MNAHSPVHGPAAPRAGAGISSLVLVAAGSFGARLGAGPVTAAIAAGVRASGRWEVDECPLPAGAARREPRALLEALGFDARLRRARAVVVAGRTLQERTLAGSVPFEIATTARQAGVPAYAVAARERLGAFDARMLDLQVVIEAADAPALEAAGRRLAELL